MRILFVTPHPPYPLTGGGSIRMYHSLRALAARHEVTLFSLNTPQTCPADRAALLEFCDRVEVFSNPQNRRVNKLRALWGMPLTLRNYRSHELRDKLRAEALRFDALHFTTIQAGQYIEADWPAVFEAHNVEHLLWQRYAEVAASPLERFYCRRQATLLRRAEARIVADARVTVVCSNQDAAMLNPDAVVAPNGTDTSRSIARRPVPGRYVFLGDMGWPLNVDAVEYFCREVMPVLCRQEPGARLSIVGNRPTPAVRRLAGERVEVTGKVDKVEPYLETAAALVVPLRAASGTRLKILEAMGLRVPVVSTSVGCEGLDCRDGEHLLVADTAAEFAAACFRLSTDSHRADVIAENAWRLVHERYDWSTCLEPLVEVYRDRFP